MKYASIYFLVIVALFTGCTKKTDTIFDKTVDERLSESLTNYQNALTAAPGWKLFVYPKGLDDQDIKVGGFSYYLKFSNNNRVSMVSDFNTSISASPKESGYRLKALQRPSLIFDTYSYMHIAADPDPAVSLSPTGNGGDGWGTDFNFSFTDVAIGDTFRLKGNFNKSEAILIKATQAEMDAAFAKSRLKDIMNFSYAYPLSNPFLYIVASPSLRVAAGFDFNNHFVTFSYLNGANLVTIKVASSFTVNGMFLQTPVTVGNYTFQEILWDDAKKIYYITSGTTRLEFLNATAPVVVLPLTNVIGSQYTLVTVPPGANLPNESPLFLSKYNTASAGMLSGPYGLTIDDMDFVFDNPSKTMLVNVYAYQGAVGPFLCQYIYSYTVDGTGNFKFTKTSQNPNAALIVGNMNNILSYIENDQFKIDGFSTSSSFLGQLTSRQTPAFYFSGYLY